MSSGYTVRARRSDERAHGPLPPLEVTHPLIWEPCPACGRIFDPGDRTALIALGPGEDGEERRKWRAGHFINAVAVVVHAACAGLTEE